MQYYFVEGDGVVGLGKFTATMPQEEYTFQTFIDRTDELPTGRILPGEFSWERSEGEPEVGVGEKFRVVNGACMELLCRVREAGPVCAGSVLACRELEGESGEEMKRRMDGARRG